MLRGVKIVSKVLDSNVNTDTKIDSADNKSDNTVNETADNRFNKN